MQTTSELVAKYYDLYTKRLKAQKEVDDLKEREGAVREELLKSMIEENLTVAATGNVQFNRRPGSRLCVTDWDKVYEYIRKNDAFELLQKRPNEEAFTEHNLTEGVKWEKYEYLSRPIKVK